MSQKILHIIIFPFSTFPLFCCSLFLKRWHFTLYTLHSDSETLKIPQCSCWKHKFKGDKSSQGNEAHKARKRDSKSVVLYFHQECRSHWTGKFIQSSATFFPCRWTFLFSWSVKTFLSHSSSREELKARVLGPPDLYVKSGSEITLICKLQQGPHDLGTIYWYKGE